MQLRRWIHWKWWFSPSKSHQKPAIRMPVHVATLYTTRVLSQSAPRLHCIIYHCVNCAYCQPSHCRNHTNSCWNENNDQYRTPMITSATTFTIISVTIYKKTPCAHAYEGVHTGSFTVNLASLPTIPAAYVLLSQNDASSPSSFVAPL